MNSFSGTNRHTVRVEQIAIAESRRPRGDIEDLAASIARVGLINPITLTPDLHSWPVFIDALPAPTPRPQTPRRTRPTSQSSTEREG